MTEEPLPQEMPGACRERNRAPPVGREEELLAADDRRNSMKLESPYTDHRRRYGGRNVLGARWSRALEPPYVGQARVPREELDVLSSNSPVGEGLARSCLWDRSNTVPMPAKSASVAAAIAMSRRIV